MLCSVVILWYPELEMGLSITEFSTWSIEAVSKSADTDEGEYLSEQSVHYNTRRTARYSKRDMQLRILVVY